MFRVTEFCVQLEIEMEEAHLNSLEKREAVEEVLTQCMELKDLRVFSCQQVSLSLNFSFPLSISLSLSLFSLSLSLSLKVFISFLKLSVPGIM